MLGQLVLATLTPPHLVRVTAPRLMNSTAGRDPSRKDEQTEAQRKVAQGPQDVNGWNAGPGPAWCSAGAE